MHSYIYNNLRQLVKWKAICSWFELLLLLTFNDILFIKKNIIIKTNHKPGSEAVAKGCVVVVVILLVDDVNGIAVDVIGEYVVVVEGVVVVVVVVVLVVVTKLVVVCGVLVDCGGFGVVVGGTEIIDTLSGEGVLSLND